MWRLIVCVSLLCCSSEAQVTCRNENGAAVDWFIIYKVPKLKHILDQNGYPLDKGLEYYYIDSAGGYIEPRNNYHINNTWGALANTLSPMFTPIEQMSPDFAFISYNDQPPGAQANSKWFGHSKGVVMIDKTERDSTGVWLVHSTPQFPFRRDANNFYPETGMVKAQTFLCVTFHKFDFGLRIGRHLHSIRAYPFEYYIPVGFHQYIPDMMKMINWRQDPPLNTEPIDQFLYSNRGQKFKSFAKKQSAYKEEGDLYVTIANNLDHQSDLYVQTSGTESPYQTKRGFNIIQIQKSNSNLGWKRGCDHSKWCIAASLDQNNELINPPDKREWTCIADVNRAESQYKRSGGALCIRDANVWRMFSQFIRTNNSPSRSEIECEDSVEGDSDGD